MESTDSNTRNVGVSTISMAGPINLHYSAAGEPSGYAPATGYANSHLGYTQVSIHPTDQPLSHSINIQQSDSKIPSNAISRV